MAFEIKPATRTGVKPLVGFYGKSGSGKTFSALLFARGLVGPAGRITMVDSESGRGSIFADLIPGGYSVLNLDAPFSPQRYEEAIVEAEKVSDVVVVDSMSHEWSGEAGVIDMQEAELERMAGNDYKRREQVKMAAWIKPKGAHKMFIQRLLRLKCGLICCLRGEEKTHVSKPEPGQKTKVITDEFSSPLFDQRFIYELLLNFETVSRDGKGGYVIPRKITHPDIASLLPGANEQIGIKHGQALAEWCANVGGGKVGVVAPAGPGATQPVAPAAASSSMATAKTRAWMIEQLDDVPEFLAWAVDKGWLMPNETLADISLNKVPTNKAGITALRAEIENWVGK